MIRLLSQKIAKLATLVLFGILIIPISSVGQITVTVNGSAALCAGQSVQLSVPAIYTTYTWSSGHTTSSIVVSSGGSYFATVTDGAANTFYSDTIVVTVSAAAIADAGADITACSDNIIGLGGLVLGSASSGSWVGGTGTFDPDRFSLNANYTPSVPEYGSVVTLTLVTNDPPGACPRDSDSVDLTILKSPAIQPFTIFYSNICPDTTFDLSTITVIDTNNTVGFITYHDDMFNVMASPIVAPPINTPTIFYIFKTTNTTPSCFDFESVVVVMQPCSGCTPPSTTVNPTNVSCNGLSDGAIDLSVAGGTAPYTYSWSTGATTQDIAALVAGTYTVTVTDAQPCTAVVTIGVSEPFVLDDTASVTHESVLGANDGSIDLSISGGTPAYTYMWSNGATTQDISGLAPGMYCVTISDINLCSRNSCYTVNAGPTAIVSNDINESLFVYPNPAMNTVTVRLDNENARINIISIRDIGGRTLLEISNSISNRITEMQLNIADLPQGVYIMHVQSGSENYMTRLTIVQ